MEKLSWWCQEETRCIWIYPTTSLFQEIRNIFSLITNIISIVKYPYTLAREILHRRLCEYKSFYFIFLCCIAQYSILQAKLLTVMQEKGCRITRRGVFINIQWPIFDRVWTYSVTVSSDLSWHIIKTSVRKPSLIKVKKKCSCISTHSTV